MGGGHSKDEDAINLFYHDFLSKRGFLDPATPTDKLSLDLSHLADFETYLIMISTDPERVLEHWKTKKPADFNIIPTASGPAPVIHGSLPAAICQIPLLRVIKLSFHLLTSFDIPRNWGQALTVVDLRGNFLDTFPQALTELVSLVSLDLSENHLRGTLAAKVFLPSLKKLNLAGNELDEVAADFVVGIARLERLNVAHNALHHLPLDLGLLPLQVIVAHFNKLVEPPQDVANAGSASLIGYLKTNATSPQRSLLPPKEIPPALVRKPKPAPVASPDPLKNGVSLSPLRNAVLGCVVGAALGDAVGLLTEFMSADESRFHYQAPLNFSDCLRDRHRCKWIPGDFTDDTDQQVCILQSLLANKGKVDARDFARRLKDWSDQGFPELGDTCGWGLGATTGKVLSQPDFLQDPSAAARRVWESTKSAANGAVMRTAVLGVLDFASLEAVARNTREMAQVTHYDPKCIASCLVVTTFVALVLQHLRQQTETNTSAASSSSSTEAPRIIPRETLEKLLGEAIQAGRSEVAAQADSQEHEAEFDRHALASSFAELSLEGPEKIGYTYKCLGSALVAVRSGKSFEDAITEVTFEGGDADTNGAVCGAMMGVVCGYRSLPPRWVSTLANREWLMGQVLQLCDLMDIP